MSTYVISDIHGDYTKFRALLRKINFNDEDTLYLLGDILDRGKDGIKILQYCMMESNIFGIIGNHEYMAMTILNWLNTELSDESYEQLKQDEDKMYAYLAWIQDGGQPTLEQFAKLNKEQVEDLFDYLGEFSLYEEITINNNNFVLVHGGIDNFNINKSLADYQFHELIFHRPDYTKTYYPDKYLVTGHTPTRLIYQKQLNLDFEQINKKQCAYDKVYFKNNHIAIDCGCGYGGRLGALCLDNLKIYYV